MSTAQTARRVSLRVETLEDRAVPAAFTLGNIAVLQTSENDSNSPFAIVELDTTTAGQTPTNVISIPVTGSDALRTSGSSTATGYLSTTDDGSLLAFAGANSTDSTTSTSTLTARGVGSLDGSGAYTLEATFTGANGQFTRGATSVDNSTWFVSAANGLYTNGATAADPTGNFRAAKSFGGTVYLGLNSSSGTSIQVSTVSAATGGTVTGLPGLTNSSSFSDFYLIQSGDNGNLYDVLYVMSATSATVGAITKFSLVSGTWTANGSYTTNFGGFGLAARDDGNGADLFVSTGTGATTANRVIALADAAGYNTTINITTADNITLYTAPANNIVKGVAFVPVAPQGPVVTLPGSPQTFTEDGPAVVVDATATVTDSDSANFDTGTLTVDISAAGTSADVLAIRNQGTAAGQIGVNGTNVTFGGTVIGTFTGGTALAPLVVTFNANATPAAAEALLRNVTFANTSQDPDTTTRTVRVVVTDGDGGTSVAVTQTVNVSEVNDAPTATDDPIAAVAEDSGPLTIPAATLLANDTDLEPTQTSTVTSVGSPVGGTVVLVGTDIVFTPAANYFGPASFSYTITDSGTTAGASDFRSDTATVSFTITPVADTPTVTNAFTFKNLPTTSGLVVTRNPADGPEVTHFRVTGIANGTLFLADGTTPVADGAFITAAQGAAGLKFTPAADFVGIGSFTVQASTSATVGGLGGGTATATITVLATPAADRFAVGAGSGSAAVIRKADGSGSTPVTAAGFDGVRVATADVTGDGVPDLVAGAGPGGAPTVAIFDGSTGIEVFRFAAFEPSFTGGVFVAAGDFDLDGFAEIVVSADVGGGPRVSVFRGAELAEKRVVELVSFQGIQDPDFRGGTRVAVGDLTGDGVPEIVVSAGVSGGPRVQVWDGATIATGVEPTVSLANFFAFEPSLRNGVYVAVGDVTGDGRAEAIFGGGPGGGPRVRVIDGLQLLRFGNALPSLDNLLVGQVANFFAGPESDREGVRVAAADATGDRLADVVTGSATRPTVSVFDLTTFDGETPTAQFDPLGDVLGGVFVG